MEEGQPALEKTLSSPPLKTTEEQDVVPEEGPEVEVMDISQNCRDGGEKSSLGLVAIAALIQGRKITSAFKTKRRKAGK